VTDNPKQPDTQRSRVTYDRAWPLEGIEILSRAKGGDGRTVEAYAAVFGVRKPINDEHGQYIEEIDKSSFNRTLKNGNAMRAMVLYNHGLTVTGGKPDSLAQVPIGKPTDIQVDAKGLKTVARYNKSALADAVLESISNGDITAQSFRGPIYRSDPGRVPRTKPGQALPVIRRTELGLTDFGPTPRACYPEAEITVVRSASELAQDFALLDEAGREELIRMLSSTPGWDPDTASILATPSQGPGTDDPRDTHSIRLQRLRLKSELAFRGAK
jgi:HK97 family phage prohead protease